MEWTQKELNELYMKIQRQAMVDEEFRKELLERPTDVIERELGAKLPQEYKIQVIESDPAYAATFVLPDMLPDELEDDELEGVAGGVSIGLIISVCAAAIGGGSCPFDICGARAK